VLNRQNIISKTINKFTTHHFYLSLVIITKESSSQLAYNNVEVNKKASLQMYDKVNSLDVCLNERDTIRLIPTHLQTALPFTDNFTVPLANNSRACGKILCSASFTLSDSVSSLSFTSTGTDSWTIIAPASTSSYNVQ